MFKFLLIVGLVFYAIYKIGSLFFRAGAASQQFRNQQPRNFNSEEASRKSKPKSGSFKGGDYIDYEDIK